MLYLFSVVPLFGQIRYFSIISPVPSINKPLNVVCGLRMEYRDEKNRGKISVALILSLFVVFPCSIACELFYDYLSHGKSKGNKVSSSK